MLVAKESGEGGSYLPASTTEGYGDTEGYTNRRWEPELNISHKFSVRSRDSLPQNRGGAYQRMSNIYGQNLRKSGHLHFDAEVKRTFHCNFCKFTSSRISSVNRHMKFTALKSPTCVTCAWRLSVQSPSFGIMSTPIQVNSWGGHFPCRMRVETCVRRQIHLFLN